MSDEQPSIVDDSYVRSRLLALPDPPFAVLDAEAIERWTGRHLNGDPSVAVGRRLLVSELRLDDDEDGGRRSP